MAVLHRESISLHNLSIWVSGWEHFWQAEGGTKSYISCTNPRKAPGYGIISNKALQCLPPRALGILFNIKVILCLRYYLKNRRRCYDQARKVWNVPTELLPYQLAANTAKCANRRYCIVRTSPPRKRTSSPTCNSDSVSDISRYVSCSESSSTPAMAGSRQGLACWIDTWLITC